jgi:hypothetical protein
MLLPTLALAILPTLPALQDPAPAAPPPAPPAAARIEIGQPAPEIPDAAWIDRAKPEQPKLENFTTDGAGKKSKRARKLAELADHVVLVHALPLDDTLAAERGSALVRELLAANQDRRLTAIGFLRGAELAAAQEFARRAGLEHPLALVDPALPAPAYADLELHAAGCVHVVGRGGGLLWHGDALRDSKAFLGAVERALGAPALPRLERPVDVRFAKALGEYWDGRLSKAAALAAPLQQAAEKSGDAAAAADARVVQDAVRDAQVAWLAELRDAAATKDPARWLATSDALRAAFQKGEALKEVERLGKELKKDGFFEMRLRDAKTWRELCADRPVLFPERQDAAGDRFADKLASYVRSTANSTEETRTAQALLDRYRAAAR